MRVQCLNLFLLTATCSTASLINANNHQPIIVARNRSRNRITSTPAFIEKDVEKNQRRSILFNIRGGEDTPQTASSEEINDIEVPVSNPKSNISEDAESKIEVDDGESELTETGTETDYDFESYDDEDEESEETSSVSIPEEISEVDGSSAIDVEVMIQNQDSIQSSLMSSADEGNDEENVAYDMLVREIEVLQNKALELRSKGKELHDSGDFTLAADTFQKAANELEAAVKSFGEQEGVVTEKIENVALSTKLAEERATCRLHEALCHLKNKNYAESISSCTDVLLDGVQVVQADNKDEAQGEPNEDDDKDEEIESEEFQDEEDVDDVKKKQKTMVVRVSPTGGGGVTVMKNTPELSPAVRARAYHRRAKARLALGDTSGALEDSRSAAFLGDRNAVALYGRLMRESGGSSAGSSNMENIFGGIGDQGSNPMSSLFGSSSSGSTSPFASMLSGSSPFSAGGNGGDGASMLSSLLSGAGTSPSDSSPAMPSFNPLSMLGAGALGGNGGAGGMGGLAKSVLSSVYKRAEDKSTQEQICNYLNKLDAAQLVSLSGMAGSPLNESTAERIVAFAHGVTPRGIKKGVKLIKRLVLVGSFMNKTVKIIGKYKHLLVLLALIGWTKSAIMRPVVVSKKAVKKAAKAAENISKAAFM